MDDDKVARQESCFDSRNSDCASDDELSMRVAKTNTENNEKWLWWLLNKTGEYIFGGTIMAIFNDETTGTVTGAATKITLGMQFINLVKEVTMFVLKWLERDWLYILGTFGIRAVYKDGGFSRLTNRSSASASKTSSPGSTTAPENKSKWGDTSLITTPLDLLMLITQPKIIPLALIDLIAGRALIPTFKDVQELNGEAVGKLLVCLLVLFVSHRLIRSERNAVAYPALFLRAVMWIKENPNLEMNVVSDGESTAVPLAMILSQIVSAITNVIVPKTMVDGFIQSTGTEGVFAAGRVSLCFGVISFDTLYCKMMRGGKISHYEVMRSLRRRFRK